MLSMGRTLSPRDAIGMSSPYIAHDPHFTCQFIDCVLFGAQHYMVAIMAKRVGYWMGECLGLEEPGINLGELFAFWVSLDAFIVLAGAVLTAYVGISGLIARMAKDRCLPQFMLKKVSPTASPSTAGEAFRFVVCW